ncbi:hybrid sensor histidine kinase/response regulator [Microbulbifer sp. YPW16]|uniref:hybrid sensor histidine kinase/response regulator n=1 Tax=Microbulbifer sp. YPW16 TaxID=2904242 RepID=UPI001E54CCF7|nr:PAS-domain containing protein [Microbulbifer sp. YPW16]UHQ56468.1 PAS domain-containing hybrid sensor histidine kinase/response regulator [Microbulbifer sp. YPW16]
MIGKPLLLLLALVYVALLFAVAWRADRRGSGKGRYRPLVYALALAVYCSSWTFFGGVGQSTASTWSYLPIYLGPILLFLFGGSFLRRLLVVGERQKVTSIADFIGSRYGKSRGLSALVALLAIFGTLPYIALQLRAVTMAWDTVGGGAGGGFVNLDTALVTALLMGLFAVFFGTRHLEGRERNRGVVAAIALESLVKLLAFAAIGGFACWLLLDETLASGAVLERRWDPLELDAGFLTQTLLATVAIICLPRQFHMAVVEYQGPRDLQAARWLLPLYLVLFSILILPIAMAGQPLLAQGLAPDSLVLTLPMAADQGALTALVYLGGFSAATGMVVVAAVTLAIMISNELVGPVWLYLSRYTRLSAVSFGNYLRQVRAASIMLLMLMGWGVHRAITGLDALAPVGLLSFAAAAQLAPALVAGLYWRRAHRNGVWAGLSAGYALWFYCLVVPAIFPGASLVESGPLGISWLRPEQMMGLAGLDSLSHGVFWSLLANISLFVLVSGLCRQGKLDRRQAELFVGSGETVRDESIELSPTSIPMGQLHSLMKPFVGAGRLDGIWREFEQRSGQRLLPDDQAPRFAVREAEGVLAGVVGSATAHQVVELLRRNRPLKVEDIARLVDGASEKLRFSQELLQTTVETISQGISVVDAELRLVAWNQQYIDLFEYPRRLLYIGCPIERLYRHNAERGLYGDNQGDLDAQVARRLDLLRHGSAHRFERRLPNGVIVEVRGTPMPGGGFVSTFTDISDYRAAVDALEENQRTLEQRVAQRTAELADLHAAKSRFLAHTSHDLLQPINAARLFIASAQQKAGRQDWPEAMHDIAGIDGALNSAEQLIGALREISRLDSGKLTPNREHFPLAELLGGLATEFAAIAADRNLQFRYVACSAWVYSDRQLLRRILQNFLGNALHYTRRGRVLLGVRRRGGELEIQVWDTGPGIAPQEQSRIFDEFVRLSTAERGPDKGLGLGLAIASRSASLLGHAIDLRSTPGRGAMFSIRLPLGSVSTGRRPGREPGASAGPGGLGGLRVLCIDNEDAIVRGMQSLLEGWGCRVSVAHSLEAAFSISAASPPPELVIVDYHLDNDETGVDAFEGLVEVWGERVPGILISADISGQVRDSARVAGLHYLPKPAKPAALRNLVRRVRRAQVAEEVD